MSDTARLCTNIRVMGSSFRALCTRDRYRTAEFPATPTITTCGVSVIV